MAKNPKVFLPRNLNPQGFLTDILLSQVYNPNFKGASGVSLFDYLYSGKYNESIMSIPAWFGNRFEHEMRTVRRTRSSVTEDLARFIDMTYVEFLTSLTPAQISALVPYIRIFKKYKPVNSSKWNEEDMIFSNYANTNFYELSGRRLNSFANIQRVKVEKNLQRFGVVKDYKVSIDFIFSDFDMLTSGLPKEFGDSGDVSYLDLIRNNLNPGPKPKDSSKCFRHTGGKISGARPEFKYFEQLYIEYGWSGDAIGSGASTFSELLKPSQKAFVYKFLKEEKKVLRLNYYRHNIALDQDGLLRLSVEYTAYPEYARDDDNRDIGVVRASSEKVIKEICTQDLELDIKLRELTYRRKALDIALSGCCKKDTKKEQEAEIKKLNKSYVKAKEELALYYQDILLRKISRDGNLFYLIYKSSDNNLVKEVVVGRQRKKYRNEITKELKFPGVNLLLGKVDLDLNTTPSAGLKEDRFVYTEAEPPTAKNLIGEDGKIGDKTLKSVDGKKTQEEIETVVDGVVKALLFTPGGNKHPLSGIGHYSFFPLKALISALYELYQGSCFQPPPVLLGNTVVSCFGQEFWANIGDILVETGTFQRWLYETIFVKGNHDISYGNFMASIMTDLVPECIYLNSTTGVDKTSHGNIIQTPKYVPEHFYKQKIKVGNDTISLSEWQKRLDDAAKKEASGGFPPTADLFYSLVKEFNADPEKGSTKEPFFFYHLKPIPQAALAKQELISPIFMAKDLMKRTYQRHEDHKDGMIHLFVDEDRGLVIDASLSHNDMPYLRSALLFENQKDHGNPVLKMIYSADITLIGNNIFEDSGIFVLPERQFKVAAERDELGVIGYYQINKMVDEIESGKYITKVTGMNVAPYTFAKDTINGSKKTASSVSCEVIKEESDRSVQSKNEKNSSISKRGITISFADYVADVLAMKDISKVYGVTAKDSVADKTEKAKE